MQTPNDYDSNLPSSNPAPPLQNSMFSLEKRGFGDDSGDSLDDSPGSKAAHKTTQHLQAWTCMDRQESQSNWPNMRKTLGKPGFLSGEDRNRTFERFPNVLLSFERCYPWFCGLLWQMHQPSKSDGIDVNDSPTAIIRIKSSYEE